jgi:tRNA nucleotidyltransferase (CCA-adding enzyme)
MKEILNQALKCIKPSKDEEKATFEKINRIINKIQSSLPECKVILGGSGEKGTWLRNAYDADIFVKFPAVKYKDKSDKISTLLGTKLKKKFSIRKLHGSRDYFQIEENGFTYEIVPIIEINRAEEAINITDVSPLHVEWVKKNRKFADEIRLTKQFFKAAKVYGAESYINGFSGYICEILTVYYGGFEKLIKEVSKWSPKIIIDPEKYHKKDTVLFELDKAKTQGPLIIIDPVQSSRNAAAAVSEEKFNQLISYAKKFAKKPSIDFFNIKKIDLKDLKKKAGKNLLLVFEAEAEGGKDDVVGCKLLKVFNHLLRELDKHGFRVIFSDWEWEEKALFYIIVKRVQLSDKIIIKGPPIKMKKAVQEFKSAHKNTFEEKCFAFARENRQFRTAEPLINALLKDEYTNERLKKIELVII